MNDIKSRDHYVYMLRGKRGRVLYIGCTVNLERRLSEWKYTADVGPLIHMVDAFGPLAFDAARLVEQGMIQAFQPPFNIEHTKRDRRPWKRAVA